MRSFVKELALVALLLCIHSVLLTEAKGTTNSTTSNSTPPTPLSTMKMSTVKYNATQPQPPGRTTKDGDDEWMGGMKGGRARGGLLELKGLFQIKGERWAKGGRGDRSVVDGAERLLPLSLLLLLLLLLPQTLYC